MKLSKAFLEMNGARIAVGFAGPHSSGMDASELAELLSKGTRDGRIPARDFVTPTQRRVSLIASVALRKALAARARGRDPRPIMLRATEAAHDALIDEVERFEEPGNAPATIRRKGKDDPLVDTHELLDLSFGEYEIP